MADEPVARSKAPRRAAGAKPSPDPEQIVADIERTREELAETLDAIAEKVSPKRVAKRATKKVADAVHDTAVQAKDKVAGAGAAKPPADAAKPPADAALAPQTAMTTGPAEPPATGSLLKPAYLAAGVAAGLLAWLLLRRRR